MVISIDLVGKRFGRWVVLARFDTSANRHTRWLCRCDCTAEHYVLGYNLVSGASKSCRRCSNSGRKGNIKNLIGRRFGRLIVSSSAGASKGRTNWNVVCDCGETLTVLSSNLITGRTKSCGCYARELSKIRMQRLHEKLDIARVRVPYLGVRR
jgi:hypothetical protein